MSDAAVIPPYPLYRKTYSLYRLSPLHDGDVPLLSDRGLKLHAKRLKEQLRGDNVRGVQVDFASAEDTAKLGPLDTCNWDVLEEEDAWLERFRSVTPSGPQSPAFNSIKRARGVQVSLEYEKQSYNALLLRDPAVTTSPDNFTSLPLLLVKMPQPVRDIFLRYLETAFDAHVSPLRLPSAFLLNTLETYLDRLSAPTSTMSIPDVVRQLQIQLAFPSTTTLLKHIEVTIAAADITGFIDRGKAIKNARGKPFSSALSSYVRQHLALDLSNSQVHVTRIACNSFHLGTERLKLSVPDLLGDDTSFGDEGVASQDTSAAQLAVQDFYAALVKEATGTGKFVPSAPKQSTETSAAGTSGQAGRRKRGISNPVQANNTKRKTKAGGKENGRRGADNEDMVDV